MYAMLDADFAAELDRTTQVADGESWMYVYGTGDRPDGFTYAVGRLDASDNELTADLALFRTGADAILFVAAWYAGRTATDRRRFSLTKVPTYPGLSSLESEARDMLASA